MYFLGWIVLVGVSLALSLSAFVWAVGTGQFADQARARFLALTEEPSSVPAARTPERAPIEVFALLAVGVLVCLGLASPVVLWLLGPGR